MKIQIIGIEHCKGVGKKSGNPYDFGKAYYIGSRRGVVGKVGKEFIFDSGEYPPEDIVINATYDVEFDPDGAVVGFQLIK